MNGPPGTIRAAAPPSKSENNVSPIIHPSRGAPGRESPLALAIESGISGLLLNDILVDGSRDRRTDTVQWAAAVDFPFYHPLFRRSTATGCVRPAWAWFYGVQVPCTRLGVSRRLVHQMNAPIDKVRGEGNCGRVTDRGEEAGTSAVRLRTETPYQAGVARRVSTGAPTRSVGRRSRSQITTQVNDELVRRQTTFLSARVCQAVCRPSLAPASKACLKGRNNPAQAGLGEAEVSRGRSTDPRRPIETGRTE
jgi:hypothetical protein